MTPTIPAKRLWFGVAVVAALALPLAACGAKKSESPGAGASATT